MRVLQYLWFHFISVGHKLVARSAACPAAARIFVAAFVQKLRGKSSSLAACDHQLYQSPGNRQRCLPCDGLLVARPGRNRPGGRGATRTVRRSGHAETTRKSTDPTGLARAILRRFAFAKGRGSRPTRRSRRVWSSDAALFSRPIPWPRTMFRRLRWRAASPRASFRKNRGSKWSAEAQVLRTTA